MGLRLEDIEIKTYRGINKFILKNLGNCIALVGPNSTHKSSIISALSLLGRNRMPDDTDIPAWYNPTKINLKDVTVEVKFLFKLKKNFNELFSDERVIEVLSSVYENELKRRNNKTIDDYKKHIEASLSSLKYEGPLKDILYNSLYETIRRDIVKFPNYKKYLPLFKSGNQYKMPTEIFEEAKYLKIIQQLSQSNGPVFYFSLLDSEKKDLITDEVFYHWLEKQKAISDSITLAFLIGSIFIRSVVNEGDFEPIDIPKTILSANGSNIKEFIKYCILIHPEIIEKTTNYFLKVFGKNIKFKKDPNITSIDKKDILIQINGDNNWFSFDKLSDGMKRILRILLQLSLTKDGDILLIDEPELHLHPGAVRRLRNVLINELPNIQIIIATHNPIFIDPTFSDMVVLNYTNNNPMILDSKNIELALSELGSSGLDFLLYDGIIWVEGKSDEIYMKRWFDLLNPNNDYQIGIQPYGGLGAVPHMELEHIKKISRNSVFVADGGLDSTDEIISGNPAELKSKCKKNGLYCWIIKRYSIENCMPAEIIEQALNLDPGSLNITKYDDIIKKLKDEHNRSFEKKKVILARALAPLIKLEHIKSDNELFKNLQNLFSNVTKNDS